MKQSPHKSTVGSQEDKGESPSKKRKLEPSVVPVAPKKIKLFPLSTFEKRKAESSLDGPDRKKIKLFDPADSKKRSGQLLVRPEPRKRVKPSSAIPAGCSSAGIDQKADSKVESLVALFSGLKLPPKGKGRTKKPDFLGILPR